MNQFEQIVTPFPAAMVQKPPKGKFGEYVGHYDVNQRALSIVGPHDMRVVTILRSDIEEYVTDKKTYPARLNGIVGAVVEIRAIIDGVEHVLQEVGSVDNPAMNSDGENLKRAVSDAYKRCWMRMGLGLHLWCKNYWLDKQVAKDNPTEATATVMPLYGDEPGE